MDGKYFDLKLMFHNIEIFSSSVTSNPPDTITCLGIGHIWGNADITCVDYNPR